MSLDADLTAYYGAEARRRLRTVGGPFRHGLRQSFAQLLADEGRRRVVDVGAGAGHDAEAWREDGFDVVGVDLAPDNLALLRERGVPGAAASLYRPPLRPGSFDALWTMSTFVHVPHDRFDEAMTALLRTVPPGAPLGIGTWGGFDFEGVPEIGELRPYRFFSLAAHDRWHGMLSSHGRVERFETFEPTDASRWEYQFAVLRRVSGAGGR